MLLLRPELDVWAPGEHSGTFRGMNLAFVSGSAALDLWRSPDFPALVEQNRATLHARLAAIAADVGPGVCAVRGRGMMLGLGFRDPRVAHAVRQDAFASGLLVENCGPQDEVCKATPPLNIAADSLERGLGILERAVKASL